MSEVKEGLTLDEMLYRGKLARRLFESKERAGYKQKDMQTVLGDEASKLKSYEVARSFKKEGDKWPTSSRMPSLLLLRKIAPIYNVDTAWLCAVSDIPHTRTLTDVIRQSVSTAIFNFTKLKIGVFTMPTDHNERIDFTRTMQRFEDSAVDSHW